MRCFDFYGCLIFARICCWQTATSVHDIEDVVSRVMAQNQVHDKLEAQMVELEARCNKERKELSELRNTYNDMKYSGEMTLNKLVR